MLVLVVVSWLIFGLGGGKFAAVCSLEWHTAWCWAWEVDFGLHVAKLLRLTLAWDWVTN